MKKLRISPKIFNSIKALWISLVLLGAGFYFYKHRETVHALVQQVSIMRIAAAFISLIFGHFFLILLIKFSVESEGWQPSFKQVMSLYGSTTLGKYIPGGFWHFVGRFGVYRSHGFTNKQITRAFILENIWMASSATIVGIVTLLLYRIEIIEGFIKKRLSTQESIALTLLFLVVWCIALLVVHQNMRKFTKCEIQPVWKVVLCGVLLWLFLGLSFFIMFQGFPAKSAGLFIGGYAISWVVGYFSVFAPGGVGIREAMLVLVFANIGSAETISVYAAMNRIVWLVAELIFGLTGYL